MFIKQWVKEGKRSMKENIKIYEALNQTACIEGFSIKNVRMIIEKLPQISSH